MKKFENDIKIVIDSDVIRHLIRSNFQHILPKLYPNRLILLDIVELEIIRDKRLRPYITALKDSIDCEEFPSEGDIYDEYVKLISNNPAMGSGEAACLAYAIHKGYVIASSNQRDVLKTVEEYSLSHLTTMDILLYAENKNILTEEQCNFIIRTNLDAGSRFPCKTLYEYRIRIGETKK